MANIAIRLDDPRVAALDALRTMGDFAPSRNAYAAWLLALVLDVGREGVDALVKARIERLGAEGRRPRAPMAMEGQPVDEMPAPETDGARLRRVPDGGRGADETDGAWLRRLRAWLDMLQREVAAEAGVSEDQVRRFEKGAAVKPEVADRLRAWMREREGGAG
jgi:hypothetical protein